MQPWLRRIACAVVVLVAATSATAALAEEKRPEQDYGRPKEKTDVGDVLAWPARVVLFPLYLVNEFVLRRPLGLLVVAVEKHRVVETVRDFFTFGSRDQITIYPSALFDFGLLPSVGFNLSWDYFLAEKNALDVHFGTWGLDWIAIKASSKYEIAKGEHLGLSTQFWRRRDNPYFGTGPRASHDDYTRYGSQTFEIAPKYTRNFGSASYFDTVAGGRGLDFFVGTCCGEPELSRSLANGLLPSPAGFGRGYYGGFQRSRLVLDSRKPRPAEGSGVRMDVHEETMFDLSGKNAGESARSWIRYGGSLGAALDLNGKNRVVGLTVDAELVDPIQGQVPFTDQVTIGGKGGLMPGYIRNRLVDRSAVVATLQYSWPVWVYLDGIIQLATGNVWGEHFAGFEPKASRLSGSVGVRSNAERDTAFELTAGVGTDPLDQGFAVSSFRFLIGSNHGL
ncbi:MAG: hypothetical protein KIT84_41330 [Labilithrix sp.]|nr:hypothetical protein [Labilithrix sp.]MCW5817514.1 hypothetical protein [Labilithrix sp.]